MQKPKDSTLVLKYLLAITAISYLGYLIAKLMCGDLEPTQDTSLDSNELTVPEFDGVGFSGSGLLTIYHLAVAKELQNMGINLSEYKVAGSSGGSWVAAAVCSGQNMSYVTELFEEQINNPEIPNIHDDIEPSLRDFCDKIIPEGDGWKNCNGKLEITVTQVKDNCAVEKAVVIDNFTIRQNLTESMVASGFVTFPIISPKCYLTLNNTKVKDGYFSDTLPCPRRSQNCLGISAIPKQLWGVPFFGNGNRNHAKIYPGITGKLPMPLHMYAMAFLDSKTTKKYKEAIIKGAIEDAKYYMKNSYKKAALRFEVVPN